MKKVININFQGRVVPIEESAYEMLQNYINSLRTFFANEEGRDEIINDIESRIGELFSEFLKRGAACITDSDVDQVMNSIGRPQDFADDEAGNETGASSTQSNTGAEQASSQPKAEPRRLYRDEEDKILAGVASGLANYLHVDPAVIRIIFALLAIFGGSGILIYIILWIVLPSRSLVTHIRKRLYRDPDDKVIAGVAGGLGKYFDINPMLPRIIFAAPFIFGIITSIGRSFFGDSSTFIGGFGGGTFIIAYIILWIVLPEANSTSEKLEMRGERVDINSIRDTVMHDMQGMKGKAQAMGKEIKTTAERMGNDLKESFQTGGASRFAEAQQATRRSSRGLGNAIAILVKAFVYFILGIVAVALFIALIALLGAGVGLLPIHDFLLQGTTQYLFALGTLVLFIGVPIISLLVWFIRKLMKVRTPNRYLGYSFSALWFVGLFCFIGLLASLNRSFSSQVGIRQEVPLQQPAGGKLLVQVNDPLYTYYDNWFNMDGVLSINQDTLNVNTIRVNIVKSADSLFRVRLIKLSKGRDRSQAQQLVENIQFPVLQQDSLLILPQSFGISKRDAWRNQRVIVVIEVPVGKEIKMAEGIDDYEYFNVEFGGANMRVDWNRDWEDGEYWQDGKNMRMTPGGLEWDSRRREDNDDHDAPVPSPSPSNPSQPDSAAQPASDSGYRYRQVSMTEKSYAPPLASVLRFL